MDSITDMLKKQIDSRIFASILLAKVTSVDNDKHSCVCQLVNSGREVFDVSLKSIINDDSGLIIYPLIGSVVLIGIIENNPSNCFLVSCNEIDSINLSCDKVVVNNGDNKGVVKVSELVDKLNALENDVNQLKSIISSWTPVPNDGGAALKIALTTWMANVLNTTTISDLENPKFKH